jgi:hypothetical protein
MKKHFTLPNEIVDAEACLSNIEFRAAMDLLQASLDEMAIQLGVARRLIASYRKDKAIPRTVAMAVRHLISIEQQRRLAMTLELGADPALSGQSHVYRRSVRWPDGELTL